MGSLRRSLASSRGRLSMYEKRFGLKHRPFPAMPDASLYYPATPHEAALAPLTRAIHDDEGLMVLTGDAGSGKTLLGQILLDRLGDGVTSAFLTNGHYADRAALLQGILFDLGLPFEDGAEQVLRLRLTDFILNNCEAGKRLVVVVDKAHHLSVDLLEELRMLGNLEAGTGKAFQAVCLAQLSIVETLKLPALTAWKQRMAVQAHLGPLGVEEAYDYLLHHLRLAGGKSPQIIDESGLEVLASATLGIPRLLNQAAHQALSLAHNAELDAVDAEAAIEALAVLGLHVDESELDDTTGADEEVPAFRVAEETRRRLGWALPTMSLAKKEWWARAHPTGRGTDIGYAPMGRTLDSLKKSNGTICVPTRPPRCSTRTTASRSGR